MKKRKKSFYQLNNLEKWDLYEELQTELCKRGHGVCSLDESDCKAYYEKGEIE